MIIVDMNLSPDWVQVLSSSGIESTHWRTVGPANADDRVIFDYAGHHGATILTQDLDFGFLLAQTNSPRPSVVLLRMADVDPLHAGSLVVAAIKTCERELAAGAILTVGDDRHRVRLLPFNSEPDEL